MFILVIEIASQFNSFYRRDYQLESLLLLSVINILTCQRHIFFFLFCLGWRGGGWRQEVEEIIREGERVCIRPCILMCVAAVSATILFSWYFELWTNLVYNLILSLFQTNHEHLFLQGEECLYLNTGDMVSETQELLEGNGIRPVIGGPVGHSTLVSNKQWLVLQVGSSMGSLSLQRFLSFIFFILLFSLSSL